MGRDRFGLLWFFKYIEYITRTSWLWAVLFMKIEIKIIVDCKARWDAWGPRAPPGRGVQLAKAKARAPNWPRSCRSALSRVFRAHAPLVSVYSVIWSGCGYQRQIGKVTALGTRICGYSSCSPGSCLSQKLYMLYTHFTCSITIISWVRYCIKSSLNISSKVSLRVFTVYFIIIVPYTQAPQYPFLLPTVTGHALVNTVQYYS